MRAAAGATLRRILLVAGILSLLLVGCNKPPAFSCSSDDAKSVVLTIISDRVTKATTNALGESASETQTTASKIRASVAQLKFVLEDVRTSKEDPNSTKKFCQATLKVVVPLGIIADADKARTAVNLPTASVMLIEAGFERSADYFTKQVSYTVQPTDDKKKIYGEVEDADLMDPLGELVASHLLLSHIENKQQEALADAAAEQRADLDLAIAENKLANQTIDTVWKSLPGDVRASILDLQRAWINKKIADCNIEAAGASTEQIPREAARLRCDTRMTNSRIEELKQELQYN